MRPESHDAIVREADRLLRRARARGVFPTPIEDVIAAAQLAEPETSLLSDTMIREAPIHLQLVMRKLAGRVRGLLDRRTREIHLDPEIPTEGRRRFTRLHEVGHHVLPWQAELAYADNDETLSWLVRSLFEREASDFAAETLFQGKAFTDDTAAFELGLAAVSSGCERYGASLRSGLRRYVETNRASMFALVLEPRPESGPDVRYRRFEASASEAYVERFGQPRLPQLLAAADYSFIVDAYEASHGGAPSGIAFAGQWVHRDLAGEPTFLETEVLWTRYAIHVLAWVPVRHRLRQKIRLVQAS